LKLFFSTNYFHKKKNKKFEPFKSKFFLGSKNPPYETILMGNI